MAIVDTEPERPAWHPVADEPQRVPRRARVGGQRRQLDAVAYRARPRYRLFAKSAQPGELLVGQAGELEEPCQRDYSAVNPLAKEFVAPLAEAGLSGSIMGTSR